MFGSFFTPPVFGSPKTTKKTRTNTHTHTRICLQLFVTRRAIIRAFVVALENKANPQFQTPTVGIFFVIPAALLSLFAFLLLAHDLLYV